MPLNDSRDTLGLMLLLSSSATASDVDDRDDDAAVSRCIIPLATSTAAAPSAACPICSASNLPSATTAPRDCASADSRTDSGRRGWEAGGEGGGGGKDDDDDDDDEEEAHTRAQ